MEGEGRMTDINDGWPTEYETIDRDAPPSLRFDNVIERDPRGSVWVKGRVCAAVIYLGWTLVCFAAFTAQNPKSFTGSCAVVGGWLLGMGITSGGVWFIRKAD